MPSLLDQPFVFVDLETTGANAQRDRITEVGIVEWDGNTATEWSSLVNPETTIPPFITRLTGISDAMVADAPVFATLAPDLLARLQGRVFVAHNARFDYGFLRNEFKRAGLDFKSRVVCTVKLSKKLFPGEYKHNLDAVSERNGLVVSGERHRALTDAQLIYQFLVKMKAERPRDELDAALEGISRQPSLPPGLDPDVLDDIPDSHGVYLFYGENDLPLYIGKSNNLKKRVLSHFAADTRAHKEMRISQQITRIDWIDTAGELGALLLEARLIKEQQPTHNQRLRRNTDLCAWRYQPNADGSAQPELVYGRDLDFGRQNDLFGLYTSQREATNTLRKLAEVNKLCMVALGLERASRRAGTPCFGMQIGKCRGACVGKEPLLTHQARACAVLARLKLASWPYRGMIAVKEVNAASTGADIHLIDHWCHLGTVRSEAELAELIEHPPKPVFDLDTYKLLTKHLKPGPELEIIALGGPDGAQGL
ncbi:3'-5' exonuclease family protein [Chitinimonas sp. BJYL2]|uniref:3'-5' exonuclease family protein n=1 Tax=Chitinimonas sp. BJYL2 TaxID=2976696 RepID=UPI0022B4A294|nr:3'-5' exonuclease family protein [Chitinimonas sp. BJYL2]